MLCVPLPFLGMTQSPVPFHGIVWYTLRMPFKIKPSATYWCWVHMRQRCRNPHSNAFANYGARGISVCERWNEYGNFLTDMGERPDGHSLERIDVNGNYEPSNCTWATRKEQSRNTRSTRKITINGETFIAKDLAEKLGVKTDTIVSRAKVCHTIEELMSPTRRIFREGLAKGGMANGARKQAQTHCKHGHEYTTENTYVTRRGWRCCRTCHNAKMRRRNASAKHAS